MTVEKKTTSEITREIVEIMNNSMEEELTLKDIAAKNYYTERHINRIFKRHSNFSAMKYFDRSRLIAAIKYIKQGNKLKDAAIKYNYTEQGLANAIKKQYGVNAKILKKEENIYLYKDLDISDGIKRVEDYVYEFERGIFSDLLDSFEEINLIQEISGTSEDMSREIEFNIKLNIDILVDFIDNSIGREIVLPSDKMEKLLLVNAKSLLLILDKESKSAVSSKISIETGEIGRRFFIIMLFYNIFNPVVEGDKYIYKLDKNIEIIMDSLKEIKDVMKEDVGFELSLRVNPKNEMIMVSIHEMYKLFISSYCDGSI